MKKPTIPVALEGYPFILFCAFVTIVFALLEILYAGIAGIMLTGFTLWFFRDPERVTPHEENALISPADGKIIIADKIHDDRFMKGEVMKISIFMNVFNVHVNRMPFAGKIDDVLLQPGKFYSADTEKGALQNEYCALKVTAANRTTFYVVQVAGLIARRIICWAEPGDSLVPGQRYGLIRFGSRVDLYLPPDFKLAIKKGDRVRSGESILGYVQTA